VGYLLRVFAKSDATVSATGLQRGFDGLGWDAVVECDPGKEDCWKAIRVAHGDGKDICFIQRDDVSPGSLGQREVADFLYALDGYLPRSGAAWVAEFLAKARVLYLIKVQATVEGGHAGWDVTHWVAHVLCEKLDGITHAEMEGFYIKDDDYLVAVAPGFERLASISEWVVLVRQTSGWTAFGLDPGDEAALAAFRRGEVPDGVESWPVTE
jgi:hypothetical protein